MHTTNLKNHLLQRTAILSPFCQLILQFLEGIIFNSGQSTYKMAVLDNKKKKTVQSEVIQSCLHKKWENDDSVVFKL